MEKPIKSIKVNALIEFQPGFKEAEPEAAKTILAEITSKINQVVSEYLPASGEYHLNIPPDQTRNRRK